MTATLNEGDYALMIDSVADTEIIMLDPQGIVRSWNKGAEHLKGYTSAEILGQPVSLFYMPEDVENGQVARDLAMADRKGRLEFEGWRVKKGGRKFWAGVVLQPMRSADGGLHGFVEVAWDLTGKRAQEEERAEREKLLQKQRDEIMELSTPVMQVWEGVLALPIIGTLDSARAARLAESLLQKIADDEAEIVIIDISGVPAIDTQVAHHLLKTVQGAKLMGAESILSGVRPETAQAMVHLGVEIGSLRSRATLRDALQLALSLRRSGSRDAGIGPRA
jgi:PAS domain S-box-containing protein